MPKPLLKGPKKPRFEVIFSEGRRARGAYCTVVGLPGSGLVGIATSKKIGCTARRNRVKRRFRESVGLQTQVVSGSYDFVIIVSLAGAAARFERIQEELGRLFGQAIGRWESGLESC